MVELVRAFREAADSFAGLLERPEVVARWDQPSAMDDYVVGALVGHVNAAIAPLELMLDNPPPPSDVKVVRLGRYFAGMKVEPGREVDNPMHAAFRGLSYQAANQGLEANAACFHAFVERVGKCLEGEDGDRLLDMRPLVPIAIRLADFLRTRVMELVVHADDLAASIGVDPPQPGPAAATVAIETLLAAARANHGDLAVIRALARQERSQPDVFPVL